MTRNASPTTTDWQIKELKSKIADQVTKILLSIGNVSAAIVNWQWTIRNYTALSVASETRNSGVTIMGT